jgi:hypothetical protein
MSMYAYNFIEASAGKYNQKELLELFRTGYGAEFPAGASGIYEPECQPPLLAEGKEVILVSVCPSDHDIKSSLDQFLICKAPFER